MGLLVLQGKIKDISLDLIEICVELIEIGEPIHNIEKTSLDILNPLWQINFMKNCKCERHLHFLTSIYIDKSHSGRNGQNNILIFQDLMCQVDIFQNLGVGGRGLGVCIHHWRNYNFLAWFQSSGRIQYGYFILRSQPASFLIHRMI